MQMTDKPNHEEQPREVTETLFCPECDYNLKGLTSRRCPECGQEFDPEQLAEYVRWDPKPIDKRSFFVNLLWPAAAFLATALLACVVYVFAPIVVVFGFVLVFFGMVNGFLLAQRLAVNRALRDGHVRSGLHDGWFIFLTAVGLFACQLILGFGGLAVLAFLWEQLNP